MNNNYQKHLIISETSIKEALKRLDQLGQDAILFVIDREGVLIGSLTDGDVRRGLIRNIQISDSINLIIQDNPRYIKRGEDDINKIIQYRESLYRIIPIVDENQKVTKVINFRELKSYLPLDVVIMAGGRGQRLMPLTNNTPKPLLHVGKKPIIEHNLERLANFGVDNFWISINYLGNLIENYFGSGKERGVEINYVRENIALGTIGSISLINNFQHDYILVTNSDLLTNLNYEHFFIEFLNSNADLGVVTIPYKVNIPYAVFETEMNHVINFKEKPTYTYYSNGGIYLLKKNLINSIPKSQFYNATDLLEKLIQEGKKVFSYPLIGYWLDIGSHEDYSKAQSDINNFQF